MTQQPRAATSTGVVVVGGLPRVVLIMLGLAATTVTVAGIRGIAGILAPVLLPWC